MSLVCSRYSGWTDRLLPRYVPGNVPAPRRLLHLINPVTAPAGSDLHAAQPVTFAALADARRQAEAHNLEITQCAVGYPEDAGAFPAGFRRLPDLERSVLDVGRFARPRKLPLIADLVARAVAAADATGADTVVYTNVDIAPVPDFYPAIAALLGRGYDAFSITRRTVSKDWPGGVADLPLMRAQLGAAHPGRDCFVFAREAARRYDLGRACIGMTPVGKVLAANLLAHAVRYEDFKDLHLTFHLGEDRAWLAPDQEDYAAHNRAELLGVLRRLQARGLGSAHPAWTRLIRRLEPARENP